MTVAESNEQSLEKLKYLIQAVIPPFDLEHMGKHHASVIELVLAHSDETKGENALTFLKALHGIIHVEGEFVTASNEIIELLQKLSPRTSRESARATYEIVSFANHVTEGEFPEAIDRLKPIALRLAEYPEVRVRALHRVIELLRASNSLELFGEISHIKAQLAAGHDADLFSFFDRDKDGILSFDEFNFMLSFYGVGLPFEKAVLLYSTACKKKGYVDATVFPEIYDAVCRMFVDATLVTMGFTTLNMVISIQSLIVVLGMVLAFLYLGIVAFSDHSDLGAATSSLLPAGAGSSLPTAAPSGDALDEEMQEGDSILEESLPLVMANADLSSHFST